MKKTLSLLLAVMMVLSMAVPAFAASTGTAEITDLSEEASLEVPATISGAAIKMVVPTSAKMAVNPYGLSVTIDGKTATDSVFSPTYYVENQSTLPINVTVSISGDASGITLVNTAAEVEDEAGTKNLFALADLGPTAASGTEPSWKNKAPTKTTASGYTPTAVTGGDFIVLSKTAANKTVKLDAKDDGTTKKDVLAFHFVGYANGKSSSPWGADDSLTANMTFTFAVAND